MKILFDIYDSIGGLSINSEAVVAFNSFRYMYKDVSLSSGELSIHFPFSYIIPPDFYLIMLCAKVTTIASSGNSSCQSKIWLEVDIGSGYQIISGTTGYLYNRSLDVLYNSTSINSIYKINKKDINLMKLRIKAQRISGSSNIITVADACNFIGMIY